jgi:hypothetical protein
MNTQQPTIDFKSASLGQIFNFLHNKFESIPESMIITGSTGSPNSPRCANGHCFDGWGRGEESGALKRLFNMITPLCSPSKKSFRQGLEFYDHLRNNLDLEYSRTAEQINNGNVERYQQPIPKERLMSAFADIRIKLLSELPKEEPKTEPAKERIVYKTVLIDKTVRELQEDVLNYN